MTAPQLLPNLGAEEGHDWSAMRREPVVRTSAILWSHLFSAGARLGWPASSTNGDWESLACDAYWPSALGPRPALPVFEWLEESDGPIAWLNTPTLAREVQNAFGSTLAGPPCEVVREVHDKAFAARTARDLDLLPEALAPLVEVVEPEALRSADVLVSRLDARLREWPAWTGGRFTLKPRLGSSGRGRVGGRDTLDVPAIRGAFARLAERGGAIFEPWLDRETDLSVVLRIPPPDADPRWPTLLGSLEVLVTASGVHRGHCGEVDSRGRVFSGHPRDEALRADAAAVAGRAGERGFFGPCGVDAFTYHADAAEHEDRRESLGESRGGRLRSLVEFNARATMGLVTLGLVRRALPQVRERLELAPGARRAFLLAFVPPTAPSDGERLLRACGPDALGLDLGARSGASDEPEGPRPVLVFGMERNRLREAHRAVLGC